MADIRISDLTQVSSLNNGDFIEVAQENSQAQTGFTSMKANMTDLGNKVVKNIQYASDLETTSKTITGAINEVNDNIPDNSDFSLSGLSDTQITSPANNQVLSYSGGKWKNGGAVDVKDDITWNETTAASTGAYRVGNMLFLTYQGEIKTHSQSDTIFVLPAALRPIQNWQAAFVVNALTYGQIVFNANNGNVNIDAINDSSASGRIYFSVAFPIS